MTISYITTYLDETHAELAVLCDLPIREATLDITALLYDTGHALALPRSDGKIDLYGLNGWGSWSLRTIAPSESEKTSVPFKSQSRAGVIHHAEIDNENGEVFCDCTGYLCHGHCWHSSELGNAVQAILATSAAVITFPRDERRAEALLMECF